MSSTAASLARRQHAWPGLGLVALAVAAAGCSVESTSGRMLDRVCAGLTDSDAPLVSPPTGSPGTDPCQLSGDARQTTGLSADTIGYELGPRAGTLSIRLSAIDRVWSPTWSLDVLAASAPDHSELLVRSITWGSCTSCPSNPPDYGAILPDNYNWVPVVESVEGLGWSGGSVGPDAYLQFTLGPPPGQTVDTSRKIHIVDIRTPEQMM